MINPMSGTFRPLVEASKGELKLWLQGYARREKRRKVNYLTQGTQSIRCVFIPLMS